MRAARRKTAKEKVVIRSAACAACALGLLLAPVPAWCADGPAKPTVLDCGGDSERPAPPPWVQGSSGPDTCWGAKHESTYSFLGINPPPQIPAKSRPWVYMFCGLESSHDDDCPRNEYCARTPERDGPHTVVVTFKLEQRRPAATEPKRKRRRMRRPRRDQEIPLRVGLWSKFLADSPPAVGDEAAEDAYTLRHEAAHYPRTIVGYSGRFIYELDVRGAPAAGLIRKLHRADNFGWTDDETGQSSHLMTVDEGLREQIGLFMQHCGIDPAPAGR